MVKYTFNYFPVVGRGETTRLLFHAAGVEFNDNRMTWEQWLEVKSDCELLIYFSKSSLMDLRDFNA